MMHDVSDVASIFDDAGVAGFLHALDLSTGQEVGHHADEPVVPASVFKVPVLVELCRQVEEGVIDPATPMTVPVEGRALGPFGLSQMRYPVTMSPADLAWMMMGISDNAATDVLCELVGLDNVNASLQRLGLEGTRVGGDCRDIFRTIDDEIGLDAFDGELTEEMVGKLSACDPARSLQVTTPRETTRLLQLVWDNQAAGPGACAEVRRVLGLQVWPHRLASGFNDDDSIRTSGKTGTLPTIRNEVGVVDYADGGRYAVAVFTRSRSLAQKHPSADAVIGRAARAAVDLLRAT